MSLTTARTQMQIELGNRTDVNDLIDDQYNYAIQEISTMYEFPVLQLSATCPLVDGEYTYLLPSAFYSIIGVYDETSNIELDHQNKWDFEQTDETDTGPAGPRIYAIYNDLLYLWAKVPDSDAESDVTMRLDYWSKSSEITTDAGTHLLPYEWERGIRLKQASFVFRILDMDAKADSREQEFDRWVSRIKTPKSQERKRARNAQMVPTRG